MSDAELAVIGALLLSGGKVLDELDFSPTDYLQPVHETIHRTIADMRSRGLPVDAVTVLDRLSGERVDPSILHAAMAATGSVASAEYYAQIVTNAASLRRLQSAATRILGFVEQGGDAEEIVEAARREVDQAQAPNRHQPVRFVADTVESTIDSLGGEVRAYPTPWPSLNNILTGLKPGALYVVGARPSVGKSVLGLQLARELTRHGSVAFVSLEMGVDDVNKRLFSSETGTGMEKLESNTLTTGDWQKISEWMASERRLMPLAVTTEPEQTITDVKRYARSVNRLRPLAGVVVDYLQLMAQPRGDKRARHEFVSDMSRQLKLLAMDMNVPVIALSQLNRSSESREDRRPRLADLRESGAVEQDADVVILMHREIIGDSTHKLELLVAKNRHGRTGVVHLGFAGHHSRIIDS